MTFPKWAICAVALAVWLAGCQSGPVSIETDLTAPGYFQRAQDATERGDYERAMKYYEAFKERFPQDQQRILSASFEIAFLYHKMGNDERALELLDQLLALYAGEGGQSLPQAPRILAEKVKARILEKRTSTG